MRHSARAVSRTEIRFSGHTEVRAVDYRKLVAFHSRELLSVGCGGAGRWRACRGEIDGKAEGEGERVVEGRTERATPLLLSLT